MAWQSCGDCFWNPNPELRSLEAMVEKGSLLEKAGTGGIRYPRPLANGSETVLGLCSKDMVSARKRNGKRDYEKDF